LLGAEFVGITQILVYIGAIVVLFLFGIMLTRAPIGGELQMTSKSWISGIVVAVALAGVLGYTLIDFYGSEKLPANTRQLTADVSDSIFSTYLIPFEVVSVLLLASLVGAIVLARKD
jgi:NADH-quinone oxidoreductase subunit J